MSGPASEPGRGATRARWDLPDGVTFVKICGITSLEDARVAVRAGANAVGFVFAPSPRRVSRSEAGEVSARLHPSVARFGVFVDASLDEVVGTVAEVGLDAAQLQGEESAGFIDDLHKARPGLFVSRAFQAAALGTSAVEALASPADAVMVDSKDPRRPELARGQVSTAWLREVFADARPQRLIVAGGLTVGNVAVVVGELRPWGVDVSSGVEAAPGRKDPTKVAAFVHAVRAASRPAGVG